MGAYTISAVCACCSAELNPLRLRCGCALCWERTGETKTYCRRCAYDHPSHNDVEARAARDEAGEKLCACAPLSVDGRPTGSRSWREMHR